MWLRSPAVRPAALLSCSPGAGAPPPGAAPGAAGAPDRRFEQSCSSREGWICCADSRERLGWERAVRSYSCKISVTKGTQSGCTRFSTRLG